MIQSASARRTATAERITLCAQRLTDEHGLDGFTMDDLAAEADVSRRTLFNYFPSKIDAVLGEWTVFEEQDLAVFRAGGPDHDLVQDLRTLIVPFLATDLMSREALATFRRILLANPRLIAQCHERYLAISAEIVAHIAVREGPAFAELRARVAIAVLGALFDSALDAYLVDPAGSILEHFDESLRTARSLLGA